VILSCNFACFSYAGALLGAGSFGRVYQGRWNSTDVAVKVIEHDAAPAGEVENEVLLLMGLAHDNIVAAYHYVTYARSSEAAVAAAAAAAPATETLVSVSSNSFVGTPSRSSTKASRKETAAKYKQESHLVMEFCDCGTLAHAVDALRAQHQESQQHANQQPAGCEVLPVALVLLRDVALGLQAIHSKNIVHGDLVSEGLAANWASSAK
jgi:serine/threonine protein kinase